MIKEQELIVRLLEALYPGVKIYLFGSRARGTHRPGSDIDLAIDCGRKLSFQEIGRARGVLEGLYLSLQIDVVDFCSISPELRETILKEGIVWKS